MKSIWHKGNGYMYKSKGDNLKLRLAKRVTLTYDLRDESDVAVGVAKLAQAGLDSYAKLGEAFKVSAMTVSNKVNRLENEGIKGLTDGRCTNGSIKKLSPDITRALVCEVIINPVASDREIVDNVYQRTGHKVNVKTATRYIKETQAQQLAWELNTLGMSNGFSVTNPDEEVTFSRYGAHMMDLVYLQRLNFDRVINKVSINIKNGYKDKEFFLTLYNLYAIGDQRLYDLESISQDELGCLIGMDRHMQSSGAQKRLNKVIKFCDIEGFKEETFRQFYSAGALGENPRSVYGDTHVDQVYCSENIHMARHGTKNKNVKAINKHYIVSTCGKVINFVLSQARCKLSHMILPMVDQIERIYNKKLTDISYDKGGASIEVFKGLKKRGINFSTWGKKSKNVTNQISEIPMNKYNIFRSKKIREKGKKPITKVVEKLADTKINLNGWGKIRTILVNFLDNNETRWIYTDIPKSKASALEIRDKLRYKQREENLFKKLLRLAIDCFAGGAVRAIRIRRPKKDSIAQFEKRIRLAKNRKNKNENALDELKQKYNKKIIPEGMYLREKKIIDCAIDRINKQISEIEEMIIWTNGGKRPDFISTRYELDLNKQTILDVLQCWVLMIQELMQKEFLSCAKEVFKEEGCKGRALGKKMQDIDTTLVNKILFGQQAKIVRNDKEQIIHVVISPVTRENLHKVLEKYIVKLNSYNTTINYGREKQYKLKFTTPHWKPRTPLPGNLFELLSYLCNRAK